MNILVIGGGGREHALCWKLSQSPLVGNLFCVPGNPGIARLATCLDGDPLEAAQQCQADLVVVGPEAPLAAGLVDELQALGIPAFGPNRQGAQLEASKLFCKRLLRQYNIPTGGFESFDSSAAARTYVQRLPADDSVVIKADGLAAGKGVVVAQSRAEALAAIDEVGSLGAAGGSILIEECLFGEEVSLLALTDGESILPLVAAQDHKRVGDSDTGANTGGMGCYSPVPAFTEQLLHETMHTILQPTLAALKAEGIHYRGVLYAGLMLTAEGPKVLEYNCRFGDPETQVVLPRMKTDLLPLLLACAGVGAASLAEQSCQWLDEAAVCVVMAAGGYPAAYTKGNVISGIDEAEELGARVFQAGTAARDGATVTSGGRVLGVTALGGDLIAARALAYAAVDAVHFEGAHFRSDIGARAGGSAG